MTVEEYAAVPARVSKLIPPRGIRTRFNGTALAPREPLRRFRAKLPTAVAAEDGRLRSVRRETEVALDPLPPGETASVCELGIPVVETGDKGHCDIAQKVPLPLDRENVRPGFLRQVRVEVFHHAHDRLAAEDVNSPWAEAAVASPDCAPPAASAYLDRRFGPKRVAFDPSDREANKLAVSQGYAVVHGSMMSAAAWRNARAAHAIRPAGQVTPSARVWTGQDDPAAIPFTDWMPESKWTPGMRAMAGHAKRVAEHPLGRSIEVKFCATPHHLGAASYGPHGPLVFNTLRLGADWFAQGMTEAVDRLLIHEFGHEDSADHLRSEYHEALCRLGAKWVALARQGAL